MTGNWPCYRFLQIEAWNACRIFYSLGLARPLQVSKKFFWDILSKIRFHSFVGLDLENRLSTHNMVISLELKAKKNIWWKNQKTFFECPFEIIGFMCWPKLFSSERSHLELQKTYLCFFDTTHTFFYIFTFMFRYRTRPFRQFNVQIQYWGHWKNSFD